VCIFLFSGISPSYSVEKEVQTQKEVSLSDENDAVIPKKLQKEIKTTVSKIYGAEKQDEICTRIYQIAKKIKEQRGEGLLKEDLSRPFDWYKDEIIYMFYADQFGVNE
ncbi:MAG: hypothetical protein Q4F80_07080, partial [bacterium]|nr:hypothetical protein [bacterium]